jgi:hypothetical protein
LLLDDGESCTQIGNFLYLDDDTIRGWYKHVRHRRCLSNKLSADFMQRL